MVENTTPGVEQPTELAAEISDQYNAHTKSRSDFSNSGVSHMVCVWLDESDSAAMVAEVCDRLVDAGYGLHSVEEVEKTGSVQVRANSYE